MKTRRVLTALLLGTALVLGSTAPALAGDGDADGTEKDSRSEKMHVVVQRPGDGGEIEVKVLRLEDGKWVPHHGADVEVEVERHMTPRVATGFGHHPEGLAVPGDASHAKNPLSSIMRWLVTEGAGARADGDPVQAWFDGGANVPMAGLRDAMKADGWNAQSLRAWFLQHLMGAMTQMHPPAPPATHVPSRGHWFEVGRRACDCAPNDRGCGGNGQRAHRGRGGDGGGCRSCGQRASCGSCRSSCNARHQQSGCGSCSQRASCGSCRSSCNARHQQSGCGSCGQRASRGSCRSSCNARHEQSGCGSCSQRAPCDSCRSSCNARHQQSGCGSCGQRASRGSCRSSCGSCNQQSGCRSCDKRQGCNACDKRGGCDSCAKKGKVHGAQKAIMLFNDGTGWKHRVMSDPASGVGMTLGSDESDAVYRVVPTELQGLVRGLLGEGTKPGSAQVVVEGLDLLPPDLLEQIPPGVLKGAMRELRALGLGELLEPGKRECGGDCDDCPNKGACKEGAGTTDGCGTSKGECKDCPKAKSGECKGACKDCPEKAAEKEECCGTCKGGEAAR